MELRETRLPDCLTLHPVVRPDERGAFVKTFLASAFAEAGLPTHFPEQFYSRSTRGVVRGLHFQTPPAPQAKVVHCVAGEVLDVVVDLRAGSRTYGEHVTVRLSSAEWNGVYVPVGFAHGFAALSAEATVAYLATAEYQAGTDGGVHWDSAGIRWPFDAPVVSARDAGLPALADFRTPFSW
ncbi:MULTISPECIES: dTDP-4-dehydrorhamnose 3,5-epimerase [unclassified Modestobacter]|uniref:dTDP-4-dehydrorhamnose 3,5-epimerase n=1 Tax=unclassified Modestobacter TaxID=2643866 RepID=UPI0022AB3D7E|nr:MULTISPECIES: dTDP-4-dehydrorhamnose 3,5-epimerase [unclassified Modestobacter]MCZ2827145.1 dTDP-4-dehydrorhamnose 3,5-epimerase [Modestobacter sp. VKM Ac-2981]MCZ2854396.1 dTDP-4-dehydrorhamnose 3,5-epimerase [Modestobacter sp. VKM Ac-2982]